MPCLFFICDLHLWGQPNSQQSNPFTPQMDDRLAALNRAAAGRSKGPGRSNRSTTRRTPKSTQPTRKASTKNAAKPRAARGSANQTRTNRRGSDETGAQKYRSYVADCKKSGRSPSFGHNMTASLDADIDRIKSEDKRLGHPRSRGERDALNCVASKTPPPEIEHTEASCSEVTAPAEDEAEEGLTRQISALRMANPGTVYSTPLALAAERSCPAGR